jgi:hypothetical protein
MHIAAWRLRVPGRQCNRRHRTRQHIHKHDSAIRRTVSPEYARVDNRRIAAARSHCSSGMSIGTAPSIETSNVSISIGVVGRLRSSSCAAAQLTGVRAHDSGVGGIVRSLRAGRTCALPVRHESALRKARRLSGNHPRRSTCAGLRVAARGAPRRTPYFPAANSRPGANRYARRWRRRRADAIKARSRSWCRPSPP